MALEQGLEGGRIPAQDHPARRGRFGEQRIELIGKALGPGDHDGLDRFELEGGAGHERPEIGGGAGEHTDAPFLKKGGGPGETGDGVRVQLGGGGVGPAHRRFGVRADDDRMGVHQLPHFSRPFHRGWSHQDDMPHTSLDCQRVLTFCSVKGNCLVLRSHGDVPR